MSMSDTGQDIAGDQNGNNRKTARRLYSAYRCSDRGNWLSSLFRTPGEVLMASSSATLVAATTAMTINDAVYSRRNALEPAAISEKTRQTKNSTVFEIIGFDKSGRRGVFDVVVLNKEFKWVLASSDQLEREGKTFTAKEIADEVLDADVRASLAEALEVIAVGTASQEGEAANELSRAAKRAKKTADLAKSATMDTVPVSTLNLGQYRDPCSECETTGTSWQRPFIVIAVKDLDDGAVLGETLSDAMTGKSQLPSPTSYSSFEMTKVR
jgi:hypothetical protein